LGPLPDAPPAAAASTQLTSPIALASRAKPSRRADLTRREFHDLRHTFASLMIAAGANPLQLAEALGHSDASGRPDPTLVWKRYGHLYPGSAREAAAALDRHLKALAS
jgi:integrase